MHTRIQLTLSVLAFTAGALLATQSAEARQCFKKAALGQAPTEDIAKFEVDASLLQQTDIGAYATWVVGAGTPGYKFGPRSYRCKEDNVVWTCHGVATLCKL